MSKKYQTFTNDDVNRLEEQVYQLDQNYRWNIPDYSWDIQHAQMLNKIPIEEVSDHMRLLIGAKLSMEKLHSGFKGSVNQYRNQYKQTIQQFDEEFSKYKRARCHPNEIAYRNNHDGNLPKTLPIDYGDKHFALRGYLIYALILFAYKVLGWFGVAGSPLFIMTALFTRLFFGVITIFLFLALFRLPISQPLASYRNKEILGQKQRILDRDKEFCKKNNLNDQTLDNEFQYSYSLAIANTMYAEKVQKEKDWVETRLNAYYAIVMDNVIYLPPEQTSNMNRLVGIYGALLNGVSTWQAAYEHVSADERFQKMTNSIVDAINNAASNVIDAVNDARDTITSKLEETDENIRNLNSSINRQTAAIDYWNQEQSEIAAAQAGIMYDTNRRIKEMSNRYKN